MSKIQPQLLTCALPSPCSSSSDGHQSQQAYTVWMKSLVFNGNGCMVYTPDGGVAFRVDNYGCRGGREVFLMDRAGNTLVRIRRKGFCMFSRWWEVCRCTYDAGEEEEEEVTPWFSVRRARNHGAILTMHGSAGTCYRVHGCCAHKLEYRVISSRAGGAVVAEVARKQTAQGVVLAEVARKQTAEGVLLGEDVLTLTVGPEVDHLLVLGLLVVRGLMNRSL